MQPHREVLDFIDHGVPQDLVRGMFIGMDPPVHDRIKAVLDVAQPVVAHLIDSFMGLDPEDDKPLADGINTLLGFGDPDINPGGWCSLRSTVVRDPQVVEASFLRGHGVKVAIRTDRRSLHT